MRLRELTTIMLALAPAVALGVPPFGELEQPEGGEPPDARQLEQADARSRVSLEGVVAETREDAFVLDFGKGKVTVDMQAWDWYSEEGRRLMEDDRVIVYGRIGDAFFRDRRMQAESLYVRNLNTYFYAGEEAPRDTGRAATATFMTPREANVVQVTGRVSSVSEDGFTLDQGDRRQRVDVSDLPYDPLDDSGYQQIDEGDRVTVIAALDEGFFEQQTVTAARVLSMEDKRSRSEGPPRSADGDGAPATEADEAEAGEGDSAAGEGPDRENGSGAAVTGGRTDTDADTTGRATGEAADGVNASGTPAKDAGGGAGRSDRS